MTVTGAVRADHRELLLRAYAAYNRQDLQALLALVSDDVDWPDETSRLHGKDEVRAYWTAQWGARTRTHDEPVSFGERSDGRIAVHISQVVRSADGSVVSEGRFVHLHRLEGDRIARLDIEAHSEPFSGEVAPRFVD